MPLRGWLKPVVDETADVVLPRVLDVDPAILFVADAAAGVCLALVVVVILLDAGVAVPNGGRGIVEVLRFIHWSTVTSFSYVDVM